MSDLTNYGENLVADIIFGDQPKESSWYVELLSAVADAEAGTVTPLSGGNYARAAYAATTPSNGRIANSAEVDFGTANANWGTATHVALYEGQTGGSPVVVKALTTSKQISTGDPVKFPVGSLGFTFA